MSGSTGTAPGSHPLVEICCRASATSGPTSSISVTRSASEASIVAWAHDGRRRPHDVTADLVGQRVERDTFAPLRFQDHLSTIGPVYRHLLSMPYDDND